MTVTDPNATLHQIVSAGARILVVDDEQPLRRSLTQLFQRLGYCAVEAATGHEALSLIAREPFDLVTLDMQMPDLDGIAVLEAARPLAPDTVFIVLTAYGTFDSAVHAIHHHAFDYLIKPSPVAEIVRIVEAGLAERRQRLQREDPVALLERALAGLRAQAPAPVVEPPAQQFLQAGDVTVDLARRLVIAHGRPVELTTTEFDLLVYLLQHHERVVSCRELVAHVRGCELDERDARVFLRSHMHRLRQKLDGVPGRPPLVHAVRGSGYRLAS